MATSLQHCTPETYGAVVLWAGRIRARLEENGVQAKVWTNHNRVRVYLDDGHIRLHPHTAEPCGIGRHVRELLGDLLWEAPDPL